MKSVVVLLVLPLLALGTEVVMNPVIPLEGDDFLLECEGEGPMHSFMLHSEGEVLVVGPHDELEIEVFQNATVYFQKITMTHVGTHLCIRTNNAGNLKGYPSPLRVRPLPPDDLWGEVYEAKFVTGLLAALVIAAMFAVGCLVYKYRWQPRPEKDMRPILGSPAGYDNPVMTPGEDVESNCSTKM